jgi:hypothetical protein
MKLTSLSQLAALILALTVLVLPFQTLSAFAQESNDTSWTQPVNLSNSGLTSLPGIVSDRNGVVHAVWKDDTLGSMYSQLAEGVWSQPVAAKFPFDDYVPRFVSTGNYIQAFWISSNGDTLFQSRAPIDKFGVAGGWERAKTLAKGVKDFQVAYQPDNTLHLAYLSSLENERTPAGAYYLRSTDAGGRWEAPKILYTSRYFRDLDTSLANVDIAATLLNDQPAVFLVWNNPALKQVFLARSLDGGSTWEDPLEVDGPGVTNMTVTPFNPMITVRGANVLLLWQSNLQSGFACTQYYQWSKDGGNSWSERARMLTEFVGCAQENTFIAVDQEFTVLQTTIRDEVYMLAWNGEVWSKAYPQKTLSSFNDPLTNAAVTFRCRQSTVQSGTRLFVIGCNETGNKDIWVTSRALGSLDTWFPSNALWDETALVVESPYELSSAQAVVDDNGVLHVLWRQVDEVIDGRVHRSLHYLRLKDATLSQPAQVIASPDKMVEDFSLAYDRIRGRLVVVWTTATTGQLYFSWADVARATSTFEWSEALALPTVRPLAKSPHVHITPNGTIHVAYAIPVNEGRGIYLISSKDGGATWGESIQVYGVADPDWQAIDYPRLAGSGDDVLHLIWRRERVVADIGAVGLYYARSSDGGATWSSPQAVSNDALRGAWMIDAQGEGVRRFWLSASGANDSFYQDASLDQGVSWGIQDNLTGFGEIPGIASPFVDLNGRVNFVQAVGISTGALVINQQRYENGRWSLQGTLDLGEAKEDQVTSLSAQTLPDGRLILAYTFEVLEPAEGEQPYRLYLASQSQQVVKSTATALARTAIASPPIATPEPTIQESRPISTPGPTLQESEPISTPAPTDSSPSPTPRPALLPPTPQAQGFPMDTTTGLALSGGLVVLVVIAFIAYSRLRRW